MQQQRQTRRSARAGFTILEVIVSMALVSIVAGFTVPRLDWARWEADAAARQLRVSLQGAQRLAVTQQSTVIVGIDSAGARLRIVEDVNGNLTADVDEHVTWRPLEGKVAFTTPPVRVPGSPAGGALVNLGAHTIDGYPSLVFRRDGSASASAMLYVSTRRRGDVQYRALAITQSTGRVDWWRAGGPVGANVTWIRGNL